MVFMRRPVGECHMRHLRAKDLEASLQLLTELYRVGCLDEWTDQLLPSLGSLIPSDHSSYNEIGNDPPYLIAKWAPEEPAKLSALVPAFRQFIHQHPTVGLIQRTKHKGALRWSDVTSPRQFERTALYHEYFRRLGIRAQLSVALSITPGKFVPIALSRDKSDFTEREKELLTLLAPHFAQSYRNARRFTTLQDQLKAVQFSIGALNRAALELTAANRILWATPKAYNWLSTYWPGQSA
jgi:hypothetical protein